MYPTNSATRINQPQRQLSDRAIQWTFIAPTLILLFLFNIFPLFYSLYLSFTDYSAIAGPDPVWAGNG
jgi:multiple sugar transport system permease protein